MSGSIPVDGHVDGPGRLPRLDSLTGLRWWAAFGVFVFHMRIFAPVPGLNAFAPFGNFGVAFFFVLSGFVLTYSSFGRETTVRNFYWRRFARIWPAHMAALLLAIPIFYSLDPDPSQWWVKPFSLGVLLLSVVLLQGWSHDAVIHYSGNPAAWTLTVEAFFYALHPWISRLTRRLGSTGAVVALVGVLAVMFGHQVLLVTQPEGWWSSIPTPVARLGEFVAGMLVARAVISGVRIRVSPWWGYGLMAGYLGWLVLARRQGRTGVLAEWSAHLTAPIIITLCVLIIFAAAMQDIAGRPSFQRHPVMVRLGAWSFAFYLVHATVMYAFTSAFGQQPPAYANLLWYGPVLGVALVLAWLLYRLIEHPIEGRLRRWGDRRLTGTARARHEETRATTDQI